jgi:predicted kinase
MSKLIIMKGLPASGKSTIAQGRMIADGNTIRINKDLLRKMLHFGKFTGINEGATRDAARDLAKFFIGKKLNVIIDDTNLNEGTMQSWKDLAKELKCKVEIMDLTEVPIEDCIARDLGREDSVGPTVIKNMAIRSGIKKFEKDSVVICDIDGTIADTTHRLGFVKKPKDAPEDWKKDWDGFFSAMGEDPVREDTKKILMKHFNEGKVVIFLSGRPEKYQEITMRWLAKNFLTFAYTVIMRKTNDKKPDTVAKKEMLDDYFPDKSVIHVVYDDRPSVINVWKEAGLNVIDVGKGIEF